MVDFGSGLKLADCSLYMAGHCEAVPSFESLKKMYKLIVVKRGGGVLSENGIQFSAEKNNVALVIPGEKFSLKQTDDGFSADVVVFSVDSQRYSEAFALVCEERPSLDSRIFFDENIANAAIGLCKEIESESAAYSSEILSLICSQMVVYFLRYFGVALQGNAYSNSVNTRVCAQVMNYIDKNVFSMKNLRDVASEMGYNYSYISSLFHKTTNITLNSYFKNKRMNEAKKLLSDDDMSISEIARIMNYSSVYAFSKAFKEHFGSSPGHYSGRFSNK